MSAISSRGKWTSRYVERLEKEEEKNDKKKKPSRWSLVKVINRVETAGEKRGPGRVDAERGRKR